MVERNLEAIRIYNTKKENVDEAIKFKKVMIFE